MEGIDRLHEIAEDVGRTVWLRELGAALIETADAIEGGPRDLSGYESDVLAWVEENGGLDAVRERLMPEGMEWPMFEDGEPVKFGDMALIDGYPDMIEAVQLWIHGRPVIYGDGGSQQLERGETVKRPAPKVLDADGVEIREKRDVWWICEGDERGVHAERLRVETIGLDGLVECSPYNGGTWVYLEPSELYVNEPVLAADGRPLEVGQTVYHIADGKQYTVEELFKDGAMVTPDGITGGRCRAEYLTHERPDSWERLEGDANALAEAETNGRGIYNVANDYCNARGLGDGTVWVLMVRDLVRRAKKLAERGQ